MEALEQNDCWKVKFLNEEQADSYIKKLNATSKRYKKLVRAYLCEKCLNWHLTSRSEKDDNTIHNLRQENKKLLNKITERDNRIQKLAFI